MAGKEKTIAYKNLQSSNFSIRYKEKNLIIKDELWTWVNDDQNSPFHKQFIDFWLQPGKLEQTFPNKEIALSAVLKSNIRIGDFFETLKIYGPNQYLKLLDWEEDQGYYNKILFPFFAEVAFKKAEQAEKGAAKSAEDLEREVLNHGGGKSRVSPSGRKKLDKKISGNLKITFAGDLHLSYDSYVFKNIRRKLENLKTATAKDEDLQACLDLSTTFTIGVTAAELYQGIEPGTINVPNECDIAVVSWGFADVFNKRDQAKSIQILKEKILSIKAKRKFWLSIPPHRDKKETKFNESIKKYNQAATSALQSAGIICIDSFKWLSAPRNKVPLGWLKEGEFPVPPGIEGTWVAQEYWVKQIFGIIISDLQYEPAKPNSPVEPVSSAPGVAGGGGGDGTGTAAPTGPQLPQETPEQKREREKKLITAGKLRINEQAALMINIDHLITNKPINAKTGNAVARKEKEYTNFCTYRNEGMGAGGHVDFSKNVFKSPDLNYFLKEIPPHILSILSPAIKIYKVFYPERKMMTPNSDGVLWRVPFDDIPVAYKEEGSNGAKLTSDFLKDKQEDVLNEILQGKGKFHGVGIKSFSYKFVGTNPAEVNSNIEADLELYFQDLRDLVKVIDFGKNDQNFIDPSVMGEFKKSNFSFSYCDLVADSPALIKNVYNTDYFRIKVIVGYAVPPIEYLRSITKSEEEAQKVLNAIRKACVILYLNPFNHDISFEENGAVSIKIKYIAAMTSHTITINALEIAQDAYAALKSKQAEIDKITKKANESAKKLSKNCEGYTQAELEVLKQNDGQKAKLALEEEKTKLELNKNKIYSEVFSRLVGLKGRGKLYQAVFNAEALGVKKNGELDDAEVRPYENLGALKKVYKFEETSLEDSDEASVLARTPALPPPNASKAEAQSGQTSGTATETADKAVSEQVAADPAKKSDEAKHSRLTPIEDGKFGVKFVFLGDVFDIFCDVLNLPEYNLSLIDNPRIVLTNFMMDIPKIFTKSTKKIEYQKVELNVADIPISLEMLRYFLMEKMIRPRRSVYPLFSVLTDIMTAVIMPAVSPKYFGTKSILNKSIRLSSLNASIPRGEGNTDAITGKDIKAKFAGRLTGESFKDKKIHDSITIDSKKNINNYSVMYCSNQVPQIIKKNNGNVAEDEKSGIYHFYIGSNNGIIKKINFKRTDTPFYKEAKNQSSQGFKSWGRLQEIYNVDVIMFGNNIYRPGDFFFVEPLFFFDKNAVDLSTKIGLGGYYQVIDVETTIGLGQYETKIRGVLNARVEGKGVVDLSGEEC